MPPCGGGAVRRPQDRPHPKARSRLRARVLLEGQGTEARPSAPSSLQLVQGPVQVSPGGSRGRASGPEPPGRRGRGQGRRRLQHGRHGRGLPRAGGPAEGSGRRHPESRRSHPRRHGPDDGPRRSIARGPSGTAGGHDGGRAARRAGCFRERAGARARTARSRQRECRLPARRRGHLGEPRGRAERRGAAGRGGGLGGPGRGDRGPAPPHERRGGRRAAGRRVLRAGLGLHRPRRCGQHRGRRGDPARSARQDGRLRRRGGARGRPLPWPQPRRRPARAQPEGHGGLGHQVRSGRGVGHRAQARRRRMGAQAGEHCGQSVDRSGGPSAGPQRCRLHPGREGGSRGPAQGRPCGSPAAAAFEHAHRSSFRGVQPSPRRGSDRVEHAHRGAVRPQHGRRELQGPSPPARRCGEARSEYA